MRRVEGSASVGGMKMRVVAVVAAVAMAVAVGAGIGCGGAGKGTGEGEREGEGTRGTGTGMGSGEMGWRRPEGRGEQETGNRQRETGDRKWEWGVAFERSIGALGTAPVFDGQGGVSSGGQRFDRDGKYLGLMAMEVGGGRMIANVRWLFRDGRALAEATGDGAKDYLVLGRAELPPEKATARAAGWFGGVVVSGDERLVATHGGRAIEVRSLPRLAQVESIELQGSSAGLAEALAFTPGGGLAYSRPCVGKGCNGAALEVRGADGKKRVLRGGGIEAIAFSPGGDAVAVQVGRTVEVLALPGGESRTPIELPAAIEQGMTDGGALAVAPGGAHVAVVMCERVMMWSAGAGGWRTSYHGRIEYGSGDKGCAYPAGLAFAPDGTALALAEENLTVLRPGGHRQAPQVGYRPDLPAGFEAATGRTEAMYMPPHGSGLAAAPRVVGWWRMEDRGWAQARVVARDAAEMSAFSGVDRWAEAILTRFEPRLRDPMHPGKVDRDLREVIPYRRAFTDERGRRVLEYSIFVRGGCEEMDRHVRWVEDGEVLLEIDIETIPGTDAAALKRWVAAFFDAPLRTGAPKGRAIASARFHRGGC